MPTTDQSLFSDENVFLIIRFAENSALHAIENAIKDELVRYGLNLIRADTHGTGNELWSNVKQCLDICDYAIAVFDAIINDNFNPNVSLEVGYMLAKNKHTLLLKDAKLKSLPTDLVGHLYQQFDTSILEDSIHAAVYSWLKKIGVAKKDKQRRVAFVSQGGTCRCAIAKAVLEEELKTQRLHGRKPNFDFQIQTLASNWGPSKTASPDARKAVKNAYQGRDLLKKHHTKKITPGIASECDIVIVFEDWQKQFLENQGVSSSKIQTFAEFFEFNQYIPDPTFETGEPVEDRYNKFLNSIRDAIHNHIDDVVNYLDKLP